MNENRDFMFEISRKLYQKQLITKDILKAVTGKPYPVSMMYLTTEQYKLITGEDWTPNE